MPSTALRHVPNVHLVREGELWGLADGVERVHVGQRCFGGTLKLLGHRLLRGLGVDCIHFALHLIPCGQVQPLLPDGSQILAGSDSLFESSIQGAVLAFVESQEHACEHAVSWDGHAAQSAACEAAAGGL